MPPATERLLAALSESLGKLTPTERAKSLADGAALLESRRALLASRSPAFRVRK